MEQNKKPLSPHLQIYKWQISSILSIAHRIVGVINFLLISLICFWVLSLLLGEIRSDFVNTILNTVFGKFLIISMCWTFSFQILNEIRHLFWDLGYGFDIKISKITGILVFAGSFIMTVLFYLIGKNFI